MRENMLDEIFLDNPSDAYVIIGYGKVKEVLECNTDRRGRKAKM